MTDVNLRVPGRPTSGARSRRIRLVLVLANLALAFLAAGCASSPLHLGSPACETMQAQIKEKQKLDAEVKALGKKARDDRKAGDTAAAVAAETRLEGLMEQQRFLKDALDNTSRDCSPVLKDHEPVLDPALREKQRLEGR